MELALHIGMLNERVIGRNASCATVVRNPDRKLNRLQVKVDPGCSRVSGVLQRESRGSRAYRDPGLFIECDRRGHSSVESISLQDELLAFLTIQIPCQRPDAVVVS